MIFDAAGNFPDGTTEQSAAVKTPDRHITINHPILRVLRLYNLAICDIVMVIMSVLNLYFVKLENMFNIY